MARDWIVASLLALGCGPQVGVENAGETSTESSGVAGQTTTDATNGRSDSDSGGAGGQPCHGEPCPPCGDDCELESACGPDGQIVCACACEGMAATTGTSTATSGDSDSGEVTESGDVSSSGDDSSTCPTGARGCACTSDGRCNPGFVCDRNQGVCFVDVCPVGVEACPCTPSGACDPGLVCIDELCADPDDG